MNGKFTSIAGTTLLVCLLTVFFLFRSCSRGEASGSPGGLSTSNSTKVDGGAEFSRQNLEAEVQVFREAASKEAVGELYKELEVTSLSMLHLGSGFFFGELIDYWFENNSISEAVDLVGGLPDPELRYLAYLALTNNEIEFRYLEEPEPFLEAAAELDHSRGRQLRKKIFVELGQQSPAEGILLLEKMGQGRMKEVCITGLFAGWATTDRDTSLAAARALDFPEDRKTALEAIRRMPN